MVISSGLIALVALAYMAVLFVIAFYGDRSRKPMSAKMRAWVYSLSLAVYCTSWTFFGAVGQAADQLWSFIPIYLGPVLLLLLAPKLLTKMLLISKQENITSIADFIAARYGKSPLLAVMVTLICLVGILPYIALQLKGIVMGVSLLQGQAPNDAGTFGQDTALVISLILALFAILFGTRSLDVTEHHRGLVLAIAFESLIKLVAFLIIGVFVTYGLYNGFNHLIDEAQAQPALRYYWQETHSWPAMLVQTLVAMMAIVCLPRQFQVTVVENTEVRDLRLARWVFPAYLILAALFVVPLALAGALRLPLSVLPDSYVISLPLAEGHPWLALIAFIGGASAATSMVIVSTVALSTMVSNDMLLPALLSRQRTERPFEAFRHWLQTVRRLSIVAIILLGYVCYRLLDSAASLATIGQVAFAAITQLAPAMLGALYWKTANRRGVFAGLATGAALWFYSLVMPLIARSLGWPLHSLPGLNLGDSQWLGITLDPLTRGTLLSLAGNFAVFAVVSLLTRTRVTEHWQASRFIGQELLGRSGESRLPLAAQVQDLLALAARFVGEQRARDSFRRYAARHGEQLDQQQAADNGWLAHTERLLAGVLGASSARVVLKAAIEGREMGVEDVVAIAGEASEVLAFNRALLQGAIENIDQGLSVVDKDLRLVAWNRRYIELFEYPEGLVQVGRPIADIIRFNAQRGLCGEGDIELHVEKRLTWMRQGTAHTSERQLPNGAVIELIGNPMPGGGFVMSFTDISAYRAAEQALKEANEGLELRVSERTHALSKLNSELRQATAHADAANSSKSRFLATVSHDLMQPLNAARLFAAALNQSDLDRDAADLARNLDSSLRSAEDLIADLLDISRLESGRITPDKHAVSIARLFEPLRVEFGALAHEQGVDLRIISSQLRLHTDPKLLRRVLQNFLTNAFRYARGRVLLGVRREGQGVRLEVWDKGPGIPEDKRKVIFEEFKRLDSHQTRAEKGLGLGLAIADGLCRILDHRLEVNSWPGKGSVFCVHVPLSTHQDAPEPSVKSKEPSGSLGGLQVLCIDNEDSILSGMHSLLSRWGCQVWTARNRLECEHLLDEGVQPHIALVDYHLDEGETGTALMGWLRARLQTPLPGIVISADGRAELTNEVHAQGLGYLAKPVKPAALRALLNRHIQH
ncbi:PAS domain-containing hybrid sensor histidine kinase/response regulator [Atopomonas sediminilitoris]|uniref:PAS domain-containing hybrid sensor histidine kinase/response regulator n=1 Tax=Atopomonas sediminilitoris TaxID=2919919 RepID=UPI001F4DABD6|nr:hybrid sensor histidine kinase/response regulator [Atopomonas sediminilitoris]MCJ8170142.1 hybrid sensor histidine kinase/response regulator [Atopomonas sediminilitoris]